MRIDETLTLRHRQVLRALSAAALLAAIFACAPSAAAQGGSASGGQLLGAVENGSKSCGNLSSAGFEAIGETLMRRRAGSPQAHQAMNRFMVAMLGSPGEQQMHEYIGRRLSGCSGGSLPAGFGRMMGMMGAITAPGMTGGYGAGPASGFSNGTGMMGSRGGPGAYHGPGPMMGGYGRSVSGANDDDEGPSAAAMIGMMAVLIAGVGLAVFFLRPRRRSSDPLEALSQRFARGELSTEEYKERKNLLKGGTTP